MQNIYFFNIEFKLNFIYAYLFDKPLFYILKIFLQISPFIFVSNLVFHIVNLCNFVWVFIEEASYLMKYYIEWVDKLNRKNSIFIKNKTATVQREFSLKNYYYQYIRRNNHGINSLERCAHYNWNYLLIFSLGACGRPMLFLKNSFQSPWLYPMGISHGCC